MQATLVFRFPRLESDVSLRVYVPFPEQRPRAASNFLFMCTGELPSVDVMRTFGLSPENFSTPLPPALKPFADSPVVCIDRGTLLEIGSSTTKTIFGGFNPDEPFAPAGGIRRGGVSAAMQQLRAGTIGVGSLGIPNTNGSRYFILLRDIASPEEIGVAFQPLGFVTNGIEALREACDGAAVHTRTLSPLQPVRLWAPEVRCDCRGIPQHTSTTVPPKGPLAGRVRRREESLANEREEEMGMDMERTEEGKGDGFFVFTRAFPPPRGNKEDLGPQAKRRRAERVVTAADGSTSLCAMAVMNDEGSQDDESKPFDMFQAQEGVFMNDIECIAEKQLERQQNRKRRVAKAKAAHSVDRNRGAKRSGGANNTPKKTAKRKY